jgi:hypothetical protein
LGGYPGESVILARRKGHTWYIAGLNGKDEAQSLSFPTSFIEGKVKQVRSFEDDASGQWRISARKLKKSVTVDCQPRGGFVMTVETK